MDSLMRVAGLPVPSPMTPVMVSWVPESAPMVTFAVDAWCRGDGAGVDVVVAEVSQRPGVVVVEGQPIAKKIRGTVRQQCWTWRASAALRHRRQCRPLAGLVDGLAPRALAFWTLREPVATSSNAGIGVGARRG